MMGNPLYWNLSKRSQVMSAPFNKRGCNLRPARRLMVLFVCSWMNLALQPCFAAAAILPPGMEHCDHGPVPQHHAPCAGMAAADTTIAKGLNDSHAPRLSGPPASGALIALLPPDFAACQTTVAPAAGLQTAGDVAGPSLNIRYCNLRN